MRGSACLQGFGMARHFHYENRHGARVTPSCHAFAHAPIALEQNTCCTVEHAHDVVGAL